MQRIFGLFSKLHITLGAIAIAAAGFMSAPAGAQFAAGNLGDIFLPDFTNRDVPILARGLDLDEQQQFIVETLIEQYQESLQKGIEELKDGWIQRKGEIDSSNASSEQVMQIVFGPLEGWATKKAQMKQEFIAGLKETVLTEAQLLRWPSVERQLNRMNMLQKEGRLSGESVDLFLVTRNSVPADEMDKVQPVLELYEVAMDTALVAREKALADVRKESLQSLKGGPSNAFGSMVDRLISLRVAVRDANETHVTQIVAVLSPESAAKLIADYREQAYPKIYRSTRPERLFKAALEHPKVTSGDLLAQVQALYARYQSEVQAVNEQLIASTKSGEPARERQRAYDSLDRMLNMQNRKKTDDPMRDEFRKREELENRFLMQLSELLGPELFDELPGANKGGGRGVTGKTGNVEDPPPALGKPEGPRRPGREEAPGRGDGGGEGDLPVKRPGA